MLNRRGFLSLFSGVAATAFLDPERLPWVAGAKTISIPRCSVTSLAIQAQIEFMRPRMLQLLTPEPSALWAKIMRQNERYLITPTRSVRIPFQRLGEEVIHNPRHNAILTNIGVPNC